MYFIMASKCTLFYFADRALLVLVQGLERIFVIRLLFLSLYKDTQLSCVFEKKEYYHTDAIYFFQVLA